jgi:ABC-2 type transport system ATP-binding protein
MTNILHAENLTKHYAGGAAVDGISFAIRTGTCFGLLGPNGAGKSTTIEILEGIRMPTSGSVHYKDQPLGARYREEVGIQFQQTALQEYLSVEETLLLFHRLYRKPAALADLIALCSLAPLLQFDVQALSGGQRQRLLLALALVNDPELIFLDEPSTGLDPHARRAFWALVKRLRAQGKTIVLTTHYMEEACALCDEIIILDQGKIIAQGAPLQLIAQGGGKSVLQIPLSDMGPAMATPDLPLRANGGFMEIETMHIHDALARLLAGGVNLDRLHIIKPTLEDLFVELTGKLKP